MDIYLITLISNLPPQIYEPLMYQAARVVPYKKYQKRDFKRCIYSYAVMLTRHYNVEPTKEYRFFLGEYIRYLGELYESHTVTCLAKIIRRTFPRVSSIVPSAYKGNKEKPPPNPSVNPLCSQAAREYERMFFFILDSSLSFRPFPGGSAGIYLLF